MGLPLLASVEYGLLRAAPALASLHYVAELLSALLDGSIHVSVAQASQSGSPRLFERVLSRLETTIHDTTRSYWCARGLELAIRRNDLAMVQKIHRLHPEPLITRSLDASLTYGSLELVQWIVTNRNDRLCCAPGIQNICRPCVLNGFRFIGDQDVRRVVEWFHTEGNLDFRDLQGHEWVALLCALRQSVELVDWCDALGLLRGRTVDTVVESSLAAANLHTPPILERLLHRTSSFHGDKMLETLISTSMKNTESVVETLLSNHQCRPFRPHVKYEAFGGSDAKVLQWSQAFMQSKRLNSRAMVVHIALKADEYGHSATIKWLEEMCEVKTSDLPGITRRNRYQNASVFNSLRTAGMLECAWRCVGAAVRSGNLAFVQWLHNKSIPGMSERMMDMATRERRGEIVLWLFDNRAANRLANPAGPAAYYGDLYLEIVQWLSENAPDFDVEATMLEAALCGHVDVLAWLYANTGGCCTACVRESILHDEHYVSLRDWEGVPVLHALTWLDAHFCQRIACERRCCEAGRARYPNGRLTTIAIETGDLQLLRYLHIRHADVLQRDLQDRRITRAITDTGHLNVVTWLHGNYHDLIDWGSVREAARKAGSKRVAVWISEVEYGESEVSSSCLRRMGQWLAQCWG